jgi:hypothetical protein
MTNELFSLDCFHSLGAMHLHDYMEPLLLNENFNIHTEDVDALRSRLEQYDRFHLVYALILIGRFAPAEIVNLLPRYLEHSDASVRAAAMNIVGQLNAQYFE